MSRTKRALLECDICDEFGADPNCGMCQGTGFHYEPLTHCGHCGGTKPLSGWHDCPQATAARQRLQDLIDHIHEDMRSYGCTLPVTSQQLAQRAENLRNHATGVKANGGTVRPEYN